MRRSTSLVPMLLAAALSLATHAPFADEVFCADLEGGNGAFWFAPVQRNWDSFGFLASGGRPLLTVAPDSPRRGVLYGNHPPLSFWLMRPVIAAFGLHAWSVRIEGILFSAASAMIVAWLATRMLGAVGGITAAVVFAALPLQFRYGIMAGFEPPTFLFGLVAQALLPPVGVGRRSPPLCAIAVFLATMTDYIGALFGPMLLVQEWLTTRQRPSRRLTLLMLGAPAAALACFACIMCAWTGGPSQAIAAIGGAANSTRLLGSASAWLVWAFAVGGFLVLSFTWSGALALVAALTLALRSRPGRASPAFAVSASWLGLAVINVVAFPGRSIEHDYWWYYAAPAVVLAVASVITALWAKGWHTAAVCALLILLAECATQDAVAREWKLLEGTLQQRQLLETIADEDTLVIVLTDDPIIAQHVSFKCTVVAVTSADAIAPIVADFRAGKLWPHTLAFVGTETDVPNMVAISDGLRARLDALGFRKTEPTPVMRALSATRYTLDAAGSSRAQAAALLAAAPTHAASTSRPIFPGSEMPDENGVTPHLVFNLRDAGDGHPLAGAVVRIWDEQEPPFPAGWKPLCEGSADAGGWARIARKDCHGRTPWISYEAPGYGARMDFNGPSDDGEIMLNRAVDVPVHVFDMLGRPVPDAHVGWFLGCGHTPEFATATTDAHGDTVLPGIDPAAGTVWALGATAVSEEYEARWAPGCPPIQIECKPAPPARGRITGAAAGTGAKLAVGVAQWHRGPWTMRAEDGTFELRGGMTRGAGYFEEDLIVCDLRSKQQWKVRRAPVGLVQQIDLDALVSPPAVTLADMTIEVVDQATGKPFTDAEVTIIYGSNTALSTTPVGFDGVVGARVPAGTFGIVVTPTTGAFQRVVLRDQRVGPADQPLRIVVRRHPMVTVANRAAWQQSQRWLVTPEHVWDITDTMEPLGLVPVADDVPSALRMVIADEVHTLRLDTRAPESRPVVTPVLTPTYGVTARFVDMTGQALHGFASFRGEPLPGGGTVVDVDDEVRLKTRRPLGDDGHVFLPISPRDGLVWCTVETPDGKDLALVPVLLQRAGREPADLGIVRCRCGSGVGGVSFVGEAGALAGPSENEQVVWSRGAISRGWGFGGETAKFITFQPGDLIAVRGGWRLPQRWTIGADATTVLVVGTGTLAVTARGPGNAALDEVWVTVDGHSGRRLLQADAPDLALTSHGIRAGRHEVVISSPKLRSQVSMLDWQPGERKDLNVTLAR